MKRQRFRLVLGATLVLLVVLPAVLSFWFSPAEPNTMDLAHRLNPPVGLGGVDSHPLGTDQLGRDVLSRLMAGGRVTLLIGALAVIMSGSIGTTLGLLSGYRGGQVDAVVTMAGEIQLSVPSILIIIVLLSLIGPSIATVAIVLAISDWVIYARMARGRTLVEKSMDYVTAARALGASDLRIVFQHLLPNVLPTILVVATVHLGTMILMESSLSYLGLGVLRPSPTWGRMIGDGQTYLRDAWWMSTLPGVVIASVVLGVNTLGDGLRKVWKME